MADFRYETICEHICTGFVGEEVTSSGPSGTANEGTHEFITEHHYQNVWAGSGIQNMYMKVKHKVTISYDVHNFMSVHSDTTLLQFWSTSRTSGNLNRAAVFRPYEGGPAGWYGEHRSDVIGTFASNVYIGAFDATGIRKGNNAGREDFYFASWCVGYGREDFCSVYLDKLTAGLRFTNLRDINYDTPSIKSKSCSGASTGLSLSATVDFGEYRPGTKNWVEYQVSDKADFSAIAWSGSKTGNNDRNQTLSISMTNLQPNTKYYVRYRASNNSKTSGWTTCEAVTLTFNKLSDASSGYWSEGQAKLAIQMGAGYYTDPVTKIYMRKCGTTSWTEKMIRNTKTVATLNFTGLEAETCYELQARTTTAAGTYSGNIVTFTTPERNLATAQFTSIEPKVDSDTMETTADVCYHYVSTNTPTFITVYYRVKGGYDTTWTKAEDAVKFTDLEGDYCFTIHDLFPNQTVYEMYIHTETDGNPWNGPTSEFTTPLLPMPENFNCDNFEYLAGLICQAVKPLYNGNKTIYANPATKELCDPYSNNPTLATLWSRLLRFDEAAACLMCDMLELLKLKNGQPGQYYAGDVGWTNSIYEIIEGEEHLTDSDTVAKYIAEKMHEVWHYHETVDYLVGTLAEAPTTGLINGNTMIVTSTSKKYIYKNGSWKEDTSFETDNFAVYHINKDSDTSFGIVHGGQAYYYFEGTWNNLDADTRELERRLKALEDAKLVFPQSTTEDLMTIQINNENFNYASLPSGERVICYVVEDMDLPPKGSYRITYTTGDNATIIPDEDILEGACPQRPADPTRTGYVFNHWEDKNYPGVTFNFSTRVYKNYDLIAVWDPLPVTVSYDIRTEIGTTGTAPATVSAYYGDPVPLPDDSTFSLPGGTFEGWLRDGVPMTSSDTLIGNTTLVAYFTMDEFDVTLHPENGGANTVIHITAGTAIDQPANPTRADYVFVGWYTAQTGGEKITDWGRAFYGPTDIYAHWVAAKYTVTFVPGGGNSNFTQTVEYMNTVVQPTNPTWRL